MKKLLPIIISLVLVVGGGSFYGGMQYANGKNNSNPNFPNFGNLSAEERQQLGAGRQADGQNGQNFIAGEIISKDDKSLTIKLRDGGSKIVFFSDSTEIVKSATGTIADLNIGDNVTANGQTNSDGCVTAQSISLKNLDLPPPLSNTNTPPNQ